MDPSTAPAHVTGQSQRQDKNTDLHFQHSVWFPKGVLNAISTGLPQITRVSITVLFPFDSLLLAQGQPKPTKQCQILVQTGKPSSLSLKESQQTQGAI